MIRSLDDTIAALATATGAAGLAVLRVSGPQAIAVADRVFRGRKPLAEAASHTLHHGWVKRGNDGAVVDEVVAAVFRAPRSYTGEDVVELSCHGGPLPAQVTLERLVNAGARLAGPGEFTQRAFLHGRIDLSRAEAVADVIAAETREGLTMAVAQLQGGLAARFDGWIERLADLLADVEARVDFAEDVGGVEIPPRLSAELAALLAEVDVLLAGAPWARAVRDGACVPLVGRPNAGKSSLFNALLGEERAIVTEQPGTTRDQLRERLVIAGLRLTLVDTAGVRAADERVERLGVARTRALLDSSPIAIWVVDASEPLTPEDRAIAEQLAEKQVVVAKTKRDLPPRLMATEVAALAPTAAQVDVSAITGEGLDALREALARQLGWRSEHAVGGAALGNPRHADAAQRARAALERAARAASGGAPGEILAIELREAQAAFGEVTGRSVSDDLLERIFARFCIGK